jgi:hypothetical protein
MSFENPVVGGTVLRIPAIQSPNFSFNPPTGWAIFANGDAYFFNITATGTITGSSLVVDGASGGVFVYSGTPAHGNLIVSLAGAAGTDAYGNTYPEGINVTTGVIGGSTINGSTINGSTFNGTDFTINSSGAFFYSGTPATGNLLTSLTQAAGTDSHGNAYVAGLGIYQNSINIGAWNSNGLSFLNTATAQNGTLDISPNGTAGISPVLGFSTGQGVSHNGLSGYIAAQYESAFSADSMVYQGPWTIADTQESQVIMFLIGGNAATPGDATGLFQWIRRDTGVSAVVSQWDNNGFHIYAGTTNAVHPGTSNPPTAETWQTPTLSSLWTPGSPPVRYRLNADGTVTIDGSVTTAGAGPWPANFDIFTLASGYIPAVSHPFITRSAIAVAANDATVHVLSSSGGVQNGQAFTAAGQTLCFDGVRYSMT